jgi:hypothetical protein
LKESKWIERIQPQHQPQHRLRLETEEAANYQFQELAKDLKPSINQDLRLNFIMSQEQIRQI